MTSARTLTLAGLITELAGPDRALDRDFARALAAALDARAQQITLPDITAMGLTDIMVTFTMDQEMTVVVTGTPASQVGDAIIRYADSDLDRVPVLLHPEPTVGDYTFATLDFHLRGLKVLLKRDEGPYRSGDEVVVRAHATIGGRPEVRIQGDRGQATVSPEDIEPA